MKRALFIATALATLALVPPIPADATDFGFYLTSTPIQVLPEVQSGSRFRLHLENLGGESVFCSFSLTNKTQPALAMGVAGSFKVEPGKPIDFSINGMPQEALWCVTGFAAGSLSNALGTAFTVSVTQSGI